MRFYPVQRPMKPGASLNLPFRTRPVRLHIRSVDRPELGRRACLMLPEHTVECGNTPEAYCGGNILDLLPGMDQQAGCLIQALARQELREGYTGELLEDP